MSKLVTAGGATLALSTAVLASLAPSAAHATTPCAGGGTLIAVGICEVQFTTPGPHTFTPPTGITKLDALVVGAGGMGYRNIGDTSYGGGGGDVKVVSLNHAGSINLTVGQPGSGNYSSTNDSSVAQGGATTTAHGGWQGNQNGARSGNGNTGAQNWFFQQNQGFADGSGGGAGGVATFTSNNANITAGPGVVVSALPEASGTLFAHDNTCYGAGAQSAGFASDAGVYPPSADSYSATSSTSICGSGSVTIVPASVNSEYIPLVSPPRANSGSGGSPWIIYDFVDGASFFHGATQDGSAGYVALRFDATSPAPLPNTGTNATLTVLLAGLGVASMGVGASTLVLARRKKF